LVAVITPSSEVFSRSIPAKLSQCNTYVFGFFLDGFLARLHRHLEIGFVFTLRETPSRFMMVSTSSKTSLERFKKQQTKDVVLEIGGINTSS
jgi:hypothetical protein